MENPIAARGKSRLVQWHRLSMAGNGTGTGHATDESVADLSRKLSEERKYSKEKLDELERNRKDLEASELERVSLNERLSFIGSVIESEPEPSSGLETFRKLLEQDYQDYANQNAFLASEARAMKTLQQIEVQIEQLARDPQILAKSIIAVGGAFSSGKSSFLNSFFSQNKVKLPVGMDQTTAISSYVLAGERSEITGYSYRGARVAVPEKIFSLFTYRKKDQFRFNMKRIISDIVFKTEFVRPYENICFVDTPGYNPGSSSELDKNTAVTAISGAQGLLWCFDVSGGTVHDDDFRILQDIIEANPDIRIYIVANRADLKSPDENEEILDQAEMLLESNGIPCEGMSLYTSRKKFTSQPEEYTAAARGMTLAEFLDENNEPDTRKEDALLKEVRGVFDEYINADDREIKNASKRIKELRSISGRFLYIIGKKDEIIENYKSRISRKDLQRMGSNATSGIDETEDDSDAISQILADNVKDLKATLNKASEDKDAAEALCRKFEECIGSIFGDRNVLEKTQRSSSSENAGEEPEDAETLFMQGQKYYSGDGVEQNYDTALSLFRKAAEKGHAKAQYFYGSMYFYGNGVGQNFAVALKWFRQSALQGDADAQNMQGQMYRDGLWVERNLAEAAKYFLKSAEQGNADAQNSIGNLYSSGQGVGQNYEEAALWYQKSAGQGNAEAQKNLGNMYRDGLGVDKDYKEAVSWYCKSAEQGNAEAEKNLGNMYFDGRGVDQNYAEALKWYQKSAEQEYAPAENNIGRLYIDGLGVEKDYTQALNWLFKSAKHGSAMALYNIGVMYFNGMGVDPSSEKACEWYRKSAEKGCSLAQLTLGNKYYDGTGVEKNFVEAYKWYQKSAEQGNADALAKMAKADELCRLGTIYYEGQGVDQDYAEAFKWYKKSAEQGNADAQWKLYWMYHVGEGVEKNEAESEKWHKIWYSN